MFTRITLGRLSAGSVYKLIFSGLVCALLPFLLFLSVLALLGFGDISWNDHAVRGWAGLFIAPIMGIVMAGMLTLFLGTACVVGLWLLSRFRPLELWAKDVVHHPEDKL